MTLMVDTCVWSLALKRRKADLNLNEQAAVGELQRAIEQGRARILGIVRQELLTGIKTPSQFEVLRQDLSSFPDVEVLPEDYLEAAKVANACRSKGVAAHVVDMLLCAVTIREGWAIFTTDPDFDRYGRILGVPLFKWK